MIRFSRGKIGGEQVAVDFKMSCKRIASYSLCRKGRIATQCRTRMSAKNALKDNLNGTPRDPVVAVLGQSHISRRIIELWEHSAASHASEH